MKHIFTLLSLAISMSASVAHAHGYWVVPSSTVLSSPQFVTFDAAVSNDPFQFNHRPLVVDSLSIIAPDGSKVLPVNLMKGELRTVFDAKLEQKGTYRLEMLRSGFRANWKEGDKAKRFMGTAEALAKEVPDGAKELQVTETVNRLETFVTVGAPTTLKTTGKGLELVMSTHPNDLVAGEPVEFEFLVDGQPTEGIEVVMIRGQTRYRNNKEEQKYKTDKDGKISVTLPEAGLYWLDADFTDNNVSSKLAKERALAYVLTLEVLPQ
ncbi:ABC transporter permease [Methylovorus sp. MM2]|uniref:DUF4198 domain-containing protein n=1 Tax=Methylovorus sp. MM2 TaxID=1848038 RepID=UPI0007E2959A|nr:DUF4198 domain-containing protein [Methylovorus sp. MM2]OAM51597.1 ABC transporter permease [Methylovorus sp. MM2]